MVGLHELQRKKNDVSGNLSNFKVLASNCMNENTSILLAVALFFRCFIVLENPSGSYYFKYETCAALAEIFKLTRLTTWMRAFGGIYPKPTWLLTNTAEWQRLRQIWSKKREPCKPERVWRISSGVCHSFAFCVAEVPESCPKSGPVSVRDPGFPAFSIWWNLPGDASDRVLSDSRCFCSQQVSPSF